MTLSADVLLIACLCYVAALFAVAFFFDLAAGQGRVRWLHSPVIYTLSISVYCTSWTFYGAVGSAARNGLEFITIYLGPTLVFIGWWWLLRKLVRIGRAHRITSIADLISSRFGKSPSLAVLVTLIAVTATTPYIALQLQSVTRSYQVISGGDDGVATAFWIAAGLAAFAILFGTRNLDANERHHGVVAAIAVEAVVKFVALFAVGLFVVLSAGGLGPLLGPVPIERLYGGAQIFDARWAALTFLSATAVICLPRQFQVTVVENVNESHLATAAWLFPLYLFGMCLFVVPIAMAGLQAQPDGNPDLYVLTLPLAAGRDELALLAFLGGFSSATSMVIVAAIAVSTMVSNHIVTPIALRMMEGGSEKSGDVRSVLIGARRMSIAGVLFLGFLYFWASGGSGALASIGLIAFVGVAQFLPSLLGGIFWRGATRAGALTGLVLGTLLWAYTLLLPSLDATLLAGEARQGGPWGIALLRPHALLGLDGLDPIVHALIWSLGINALAFMVVSVLTEPAPLERLQGAQFVDVFRTDADAALSFEAGSARAEDLFILAQRILGRDAGRALFDDIARTQDRATGLPRPTTAMIAKLERQLAGSVGAASAHAMVSRVAGRAPVGVTELIDIADETQRLLATTRALAEKSAELERAASQLREANDQLRTLDAQKDAFLSQVSHELRTPMTAIRSFTEILMTEDTSPDDRARFTGIIQEESQRLTRLLDEILDISRLERSAEEMELTRVSADTAIAQALDAVAALIETAAITVDRAEPEAPVWIMANPDRLRQVLINLLGNAVKYNANPNATIRIETRTRDTTAEIDVIDSGGGVSRQEAAMVFEMFARGEGAGKHKGAGLGLPISRAIMRKMKGELTVEFAPDGTSFFRITLARATQAAEARAPAAGG